MTTWYGQIWDSFNFDDAALADGVYTSTTWNSASDGSGTWLSWNENQTIVDAYAEGDTFRTGSGLGATLNVDITKHCVLYSVGGSFLIYENRIINADCITNSLSGISIEASCTVVINGNVTGGVTSSAIGIFIKSNVTANITINGTVNAGSSGNSYGLYAAGIGSTITINNGSNNAVVSIGTVKALVVSENFTTVNITGNVVSGTSGTGIMLNNTGATLNITGNVIGGSSSTGYGINIASAATSSSLTIVGNVNGAVGAAIYSSAAGVTIDVTGNITCTGTGAAITLGAAATLAQRNGNITASGTAGSSGGHGISITSNNCILNLSGNVYGGQSAGINNICGIKVSYSGTTSFTLALNGNVYAGLGILCHGISVVSATAFGTYSVVINGNIFNNEKALGVSAPYTLGSSNQYFTQNPITGGSMIKFPMQLAVEKVLKGQVHGNVVGTLAPASPFRRLKRFV
jgi:hypothetical protein